MSMGMVTTLMMGLVNGERPVAKNKVIEVSCDLLITLQRSDPLRGHNPRNSQECSHNGVQ